MSAYVVVDIDVHDPEIMRQYRKIAYPVLEAYGGRTIARGLPEGWEGDWDVSAVLVIEFPDAEKARAWFNSADYAPALAMRRQASTARVMLIPGA